MSDDTPLSPEQSHSPFSDKLPKDGSLKMSLSPTEINEILRYEIAKVDQAPRSHPLENIPKYPAPHILSLFANLAYEKEKEIRSALVEVEGWKLLTTANSKNEYFGAVFWHPANHQIVIAHRGTDPSKIVNDVIRADLFGVYFNKFVDRMSSAATMAEEILTIFDKVGKELKYPIELFFTGHSLGGWLAQITTFTTEYLRPMEYSKGTFLFQKPSSSKELSSWPYHAHAVVFESPGCADMLRKMRLSFDVKSRDCTIDLDMLDITNYLSAPNIINSCNEHLGTCYRLITDLSELNKEENAIEKWFASFFRCPEGIKYTRVTHSKGKIYELLKSLEKESDCEVKAKVKEIVDWPKWSLLLKKDYKKPFQSNLLNSGNHYHPDATLEKCIDRNNLSLIRYQTKDFDELSSHLSVFTQSERNFLKRYAWMRELGLSVFKPDEWLTCLNNVEKQTEAKKILRDFCIEDKKLHCNTTKIPSEFIPYVKRLLKLYPSIDNSTRDSLTKKGIIKEIFQFEAESYRRNFEQLNAMQVSDEWFDICEFLNKGNKRIWHAIVPETFRNDKIGLICRVYMKILQQKIAGFTDKSRYTILELKRLFCIMQHGIDFKHVLEDGTHLLIIDCTEFELDQGLLNNLLNMAKDEKCMKLLMVSSNKRNPSVKFDQHQLGDLFVEETLPLISWEHLMPQYQQTLLEKRIRLAGCPGELKLGKDRPLELGTDAMMQLIEAGDVITIGKEPQRLSDLEAAYAKCFVKIEAAKLRRELEKVEKDSPLFLIDGLPDRKTLIEKLGVVDEEDVAHLESRISTDYKLDSRNIILFSGEYSEQQFKQFCRDHPEDRIYWISSINGEWLWRQLYDPGFYVERKLNQVAVPGAIKSILMDKNTTTSFVASGITIHELLHFLNINDEDKKIISSRLTVVDKFEDIRSSNLHHNDSVHCLSAVPNGNGGQQLVRRLPVSIPPDTKDKFAALKGEPLSIIVDYPGMGKSTTLTRLTEKRLNENWVMRLNLKDCSSHLSKLPLEPNIDQVIDFIWMSTGGESESSLAIAIFKCNLKEADVLRPLLLLVDGFDEIGQDQQEKIIALLKLLRGIFEKSKHQIVITTRRHPELEYKLKMLYTVEFTPLDRDHQIEFLRELWLRRSELLMSNLSNVTSKAQAYAKKLLDEADVTLGEEKAPFIGIPMQLRLLAECFRDDFLEFANSNCNRPTIESVGLLGIYQLFIQAKHDQLYREKTSFSESSCPVYERWVREKFSLIHQQLARTILFSKEDNKLFYNCSIQDDELIELYRLGLIQKIRDKEGFEFIHLTFVEYHVGESLMRKLPEIASTTPINAIKKFFFGDILIKPKYGVVRKFLNNMLITHEEHIEEIRAKVEAIESHSIFQRDIFLHVAVAEGNCEIIKFLFQTLDKAELKALLSLTPDAGEFKHKTPLHIAAERGKSDVVGFLLARIEENEESAVENFAVNARDENGENPLHLAIKMRHNEVARMLLKSKHVDVNGISNYKRTALHFAALRGNSDIVRILLARIEENEDSKVDNFAVNAKDEDGETPLHLAIKHARVEVVQILLKAKHVDVNAIPHNKRTNLHIAASSGNSDIVRIFLARIEENEESKVENFAFNAKDEDGETPLHLAIDSGSVEVVKILLKAKHVDVNAISHDKRTILHIAARGGNSDIVEILLARIEENEESKVENFAVNAKDQNGETPLQYAIEYGHVEVVQILLKAKHVDVNAISHDRTTALHFAARGGNSDIVEILSARIEENEGSKVDNFAVNAKDEDGETPLHLAIKHGCVEVVQILLKAKNVDVNAISLDKRTALHIAARKGNSDIVEILLARIEENEESKVENFAVNAKDEYGETPLQYAIKNSRVEVVQILLKAKHVDVNAISHNKRTALHFAARGGNSDIFEILLARIEENEESKVENFAVNAKDKYGETPLQYAIKNGRVEVVQILLKAKHVDVNALPHNKRTNLHNAASSGNSDIVRIFLARIEENEESKVENFAVNAKDEDGETPLHLAIDSGSVEVVKILLKAKHVDFNAISHYKRTALHIAARKGNSDIVRILLARIEENEESKVENFAVNAKDKYGETPLHLAIREGHDEVVRMLLKAKHVDVNAISHQKGTPLHKVAEKFYTDTIKILQDLMDECGESKVENHVVDARDEYKETPLRIAIRKDHVEIVEILLRAINIDVNIKGGKSDETALHYAIRSSHRNKTKIIQYLLSSEAIDVNSRDKYNMTPLHLASRNNQVEIVKKLLAARNIDVNAKGGHDNMTPMQMASDEGHTEVVKLLVKYHG